MEHLAFKPTPEDYAYTFGGAEPRKRIKPGTVLTLWSQDAFGGVLTSEETLPSTHLTSPDLNPQTGPFYIEGAEPGDTLAIHIVDLTPANDWAASTTIRFFGGLTSTPAAPSLQEPLEERTWIYRLSEDRKTAAFQAQGSDFSLPLPLSPMLGTIGVAPAGREVRTSLVPEAFGGNMDVVQMKAGATMYFRVNVEGALFSLGDGHYRQGEGESCGTALEGAMYSTVIVDIIKGGGPAWPRLEDDESIMSIGSARPLENAWRIGQVEMVGWLSELYGLDKMDSYQLLAQISRCPIGNVVDTNWSVPTMVEKQLLPEMKPFDGIHEEMKARAATLGSINYEF